MNGIIIFRELKIANQIINLPRTMSELGIFTCHNLETSRFSGAKSR